MESPAMRRVSITMWLSLLASGLTLAALAVFWIAWSRIELRIDEDRIKSLYKDCYSPLAVLSVISAMLVLFGSRRNPVLMTVITATSSAIAVMGCAWLPSELFYPFYVFPSVWLQISPLVCLILIAVIGVRNRIWSPFYYGRGLVISILLFILFPPGYFMASVRSSVSRVKTDMRTITTALESYFVEYNAYPPWTINPKEQMAFASNLPMPSFRRWVPGGSATLTTPLAYTAKIPLDPLSTYFHKDSTFAYWVPEEGGWILGSPGPNGVFDIDFPTLRKVYRPLENNPTVDLKLLSYDATNGTRSRGDIWRVKQ